MQKIPQKSHGWIKFIPYLVSYLYLELRNVRFFKSSISDPFHKVRTVITNQNQYLFNKPLIQF